MCSSSNHGPPNTLRLVAFIKAPNHIHSQLKQFSKLVIAPAGFGPKPEEASFVVLSFPVHGNTEMTKEFRNFPSIYDGVLNACCSKLIDTGKIR